MPSLKSHKTVEQIAKKHRLDVSFIQKQLDMGEPIEHEHTKDHQLSRHIALQHLDEIPDYYTRLKKMEADAKKHHKKFKDVKEALDGKSAKDPGYSLRDWFKGGGWVQAGGKYDGKPCAKQPGQKTKPYCRDPDDRATMDKKERNKRAAKKRREDPNPNESGSAKIVTQEAAGEKDACYKKVKSRYKKWPSAYASGALVKCRKVGASNWGTKTEETHMHEEQRYCPLCDKRETRSECSYGEKAWDKVSVKDEEYSMVRSELETLMNAAKRLNAKVGKGEGNLEAWVQSKITKAADYIDTAADYVNSGEMEEQKIVDKIMDEMRCWPGYEKKGTQKLFGKKYNRCVKKEDVSIEDADGNTFAEVVDIIKPEPIKGFKSQIEEATRMPAQTGNIVAVTISWRGKYYSLKMFFPQSKLPSRKDINDELQKVYPNSRVVYHAVSEIQPGQPLIQAFGPQGGSFAKSGPNKNYVKPMGEEVEVNEDWQKINRKDKTDGLSPAAVKAYRRENPGSKLKTAVTTPPSELKPGSADWKRRKNFCSRSRSWTGERGKAARKRWNCN
jgi:hypothetical protein